MANRGYRFNKAGIKKILGEVNTEYLFLAGATIRSKAKSSLKVAKDQNGKRERSKAGDAPKINSNSSPLKTLLRFAFDPGNLSMVVGSEIFQSRKSDVPAPKTLERGGSVVVKRKVYQPQNRRKWGQTHWQGSRPQGYSYFRSEEARQKAVQSTAFKDWKSRQKMVEKSETIKVEARPYMRKALNQVLSKRMSEWLYRKAVAKAAKK